MPKPTKGPRLGGSPSHQRHILANLATSLFEHGKITTTETKARTLRPYAEKLITKAKRAHAGENPVHQRREVLKLIRDKGVVHTLFTEIAPTFAERPGGYTRITKIGPRKGDNAPMAVIELVTEAYTAPAPRAAQRSGAQASGQPASDRKVSTEKAAAPSEAAPSEAAPSEAEQAQAEQAQADAAEEPSEDVEPASEAEQADEPAVEPAPGTDDPATQAAEEDAPPVK